MSDEHKQLIVKALAELTTLRDNIQSSERAYKDKFEAVRLACLDDDDSNWHDFEAIRNYIRDKWYFEATSYFEALVEDICKEQIQENKGI